MEDKEHIKEILSNHGYEYLKDIGKGSFSNVMLCKSKQYNHLFAVKRVLKKNLAKNEIQALISLIHAYIVKLYVTFDDEEYHYLVMEYCPNGSLREKGCLNYDKFVFYARQLLEVLDYCHSQKIVHRDIKPDNVFLDEYQLVKLGDFGFADKFSKQQSSIEKCGSLMYAAPEMLNIMPFDPFKTDIWALGITFFYMATGQFPFPNCPPEDLRQLISLGQLDYSNVEMDPKVKSLIMKMTSINPLFRPPANKLLKMPIFAQKLPPKSTKKISSYSNLIACKARANLMRNPLNMASFSGDLPENNTIQPKSDMCIPLANVRTFKSYNIFANVQKQPNTRFYKYD